MEKVKVTTMDELTPLIGKKVIVKDKQIGIFLTENGQVHAINNVCPHKEGPLSEGTVSGEYVYCPLHDQKIDLNTGKCKNLIQVVLKHIKLKFKMETYLYVSSH